MSGQQKVQEYLQRNKIGALFEELMGKIVVDQPEEPLRYLVSVLQTKLDRKSQKSLLSKSVSGTVPRVRGGSPERSKLAASFAGEKLTADKDRQYNKPWLASSKPPKSKPDTVDGSVATKSVKPVERGSRVDLSTFDDIFEDARKPVAAAAVAVAAASTTAASATAASLNRPDDLHDPAFTRFQDSVSQVIIINRFQDDLSRHMTEEEMVSAEVPVSIRTISETVYPVIHDALQRAGVGGIGSPIAPVNRFKKGQKADAMNHKKKLEEAVVEEERKLKQRQQEISDDSGYDDSMSRDSAIELLEDIELLTREGAKNVKASGYAVRHAPSVDVKVGICARCAKFLDGDLSSGSPVHAVSFGQQPNFSKDIGPFSQSSSGPRTLSSPVAQSSAIARHSGIEGFLEQSIRDGFMEQSIRPVRRRRSPSPGPFESDDEEFESVSQVTGPRRPVWQDDDEEVTPRKGSHMMSRSVTAEKLERLSSRSDTGDVSKSLSKLPPSGGTPRNNSSGAATSKQSSASARRNSQALSDDDENIISSLTRNSNQWAVQDYDTDGSTVYVTGGKSSKTKGYKPRAY